MSFYDAERVVKDTLEIYQTKLNTIIDCINTEKNDSVILENIENDKYVFGVITENMLNFDSPFIMYGMEPTTPKEAQANNFVKEVRVSFRVFMPDCGNAERDNEFYKLLRYQRALETVIVKNCDVYRGYGKPKVTSLTPDAFEYNSKVFLHIGVEISVSITAR